MKQEHGFAIIEALAAALLLAVGISATLTSFDSSRRLTLVAEHQTTLAQRAQQELERVLSLPWNQVALTGTSASWSTTPGSYTYVSNVPGSCPGTPSAAAPTYQPDHSGASSASEQLVINGCTYSYTVNGNTQTVIPSAGTVQPVQTWTAPLSNGTTISGNIYDFVTWTADPTCSQTSTPGSKCSTTDDYKRVTVVVTQNGVSQPSNPAIVSGFVTPLPSGPGPVNQVPGNFCVNSATVACTPTPPYYPNCSGTMSTTPPTGTGASCPLPSGPCLTPPTGTPVSTTPAIPAGATWTFTGTGEMTAFLQGNNGQAISGTLCLAVYVYPQGLLGALPPVTLGTPQSQAFNIGASLPPTPVTFDFNVGSGDYAIASTGLAQIGVEVWVAGSSTPVNLVTGSPAAASQITFLMQG